MTETLTDVAISLSASLPSLIVLKTTVAAAAALVAVRLLGRSRASVRHLVLACAFATMLALPITAAIVPARTLRVDVSAPARVTAPPAPAAATTPQRAAAPALSQSEKTMTISLATVASIAWLLGVLFFLASLIGALTRLRQLRRTALPWLEGIPVLQQAARDAGLKRRVELLLHEDAVAPMTFGAVSPVIVLPIDAPGWTAAALQRALIHELEHVHRHDWPVHIATRAICVAYWFNPLVWIAERRLSLEAERACDDAVIARQEGIDYAQQLVALARRLASAPTQPALAMASRSDLSRRVAALLDRRQVRGRAGAVRITLAAAAAIGFVAATAPVRVAGAAIIDSTDDQRRTVSNRVSGSDRALVEAAEQGDLNEVKWLLDAGAHVDAAVDGDGSPLIVAAREGHLALVTLLLDRGADPNLAVRGDGNALIMAAREGHLQIVDLLLNRGASIDQVVPDDENALIQASAEGHLAVVKLLVARGADVNARVWVDEAFERPRGEWRTPLSQARRGGHRDVEAFLIASGARE